MSIAARTALLLILAIPVIAQEATTTTATTATTTEPTETAEPTTTSEPATTTAAPESLSSGDVREQFRGVINTHPPELGTILALDPTLLSDDAFLARYPDLARFVAAHPEVRRHSAYYVSGYELPSARAEELDRSLEPLFAFCGFLLFAFALSWLIRTIIEQHRWSRVSRRQSEVHNKILDRFGTTAELLEYVKSPAGTKFLEGAPIPVHETESQNPPLARIVRSVQTGVIVTVAAIGFIVVGASLAKELGDGFFGIGVIALCIGVGFIASAAVSLFLSRRLGLWRAPESGDATDVQAHDSGLMR
jgi:hypothetical protein